MDQKTTDGEDDAEPTETATEMISVAKIAGVARPEWLETLKRSNIDEQWWTDDSQNNYKDAAKPWRRCAHRRKDDITAVEKEK